VFDARRDACPKRLQMRARPVRRRLEDGDLYPATVADSCPRMARSSALSGSDAAERTLLAAMAVPLSGGPPMADTARATRAAGQQRQATQQDDRRAGDDGHHFLRR
jgi:hypothetical protein